MRTFTKYAGSLARKLVNDLPKLTGSVDQYQKHMVELGKQLADPIIPELRSFSEICVICTVEDADFLARGLIDRLEEEGLEHNVHLLCLWNKRIKEEDVSISPILREYRENIPSADTIFVVIKSIISGACVVKTNITRAISMTNPERIIVAAPVMLKGAEARLANEFPESVSSKFEFVHFAEDTEKDGENVRPGVGGSVYELLGLGSSDEKNKYVPQLVKERRRRLFSAEPLHA